MAVDVVVDVDVDVTVEVVVDVEVDVAVEVVVDIDVVVLADVVVVASSPSIFPGSMPQTREPFLYRVIWSHEA